MNLSKNDFLN